MKKIFLYSILLVLPLLFLSACGSKTNNTQATQPTPSTQDQVKQPSDTTTTDTTKQSAPTGTQTDTTSSSNTSASQNTDSQAQASTTSTMNVTETLTIIHQAEEQGSVEKCSELQDSNLVRECQMGVIVDKAVAEKNSVLCSQLSFEEDRTYCQNQVAESQK